MGYPQAMVDDLVRRTRAGGEGRLLDLACGTGQIAFSMLSHFAEIWAVDQEQDMIEVVRAKSAALEAGRVRALVSTAEDLDAPEASFEMVAVGNAWHRLRREAAATRAFRWLAPGGHLALLWSNSPWAGDGGWQTAMSAVLDTWKTRTGASERVPAGWERLRRERPDGAILEEAGFQLLGSRRFPGEHDWTVEGLIGFVYSTSFLSRRALYGHAAAFETDLRHEMRRYEQNGCFHETIDCAYDLARRPN